jgi:beta-1,4-N-acetylglucosaminyltransferase
MDTPKKKVAVVSSCGGHLTEVRLLRRFYETHEHFYVLNDRVVLPGDMEGKTRFVSLFERDLNFFVNLAEAWRILRAEKPDLIISTGAGIIVPFAICAKVLRIPVLFVETLCRVNHPSLTAKIMYRLADRFFYQWESLGKHFPKGECTGPLL